MKTHKSPEESDVTPSKKKLKQARLPFKLLSDVTPVPESPQTRKRKLSAPEAEPVTKVGKVTKENGTVHDLVVISDDDSKDAQRAQQEDKLHNPLANLVDAAWKKKLQRSSRKKKNPKKLKGNKSEVQATDVKESNESVCMDVDDVDENVNSVCNNKSLDDSSQNVNESESINLEEKETVSVNSNEKSEQNDNNIVLEESNTLPDSESKYVSEVKNNVLEKTDNFEGQTNMDVSDKENSDTEKSPKLSDETPKRSTRNRSKVEEKPDLNKSDSSALEKSIDLNPSTPKHNTRSSSMSSNQDVSLNNSTTVTPKRQAQKNLESAKKKEEREKEKQEREQKRQLEKEERAKQKQEKEDAKRKEREEKEEAKKKEREEKEEQKRKEKEEKEEQKRKEREEKEKQKELEKKLREEKEKQKRKEKEEKEEMRRKEKEAKEEEKRKKQEALELEKQEQEQKKKKAAEAFVNFFVPKQKTEKDQHTIGPVSKNNLLSSFTIKSDMRLAPTTRKYISDEQKQELDSFLQEQETPKGSLYIQNLKEAVNKPMTNGATWPLNDKENDDDVMIVEDDLPPIDDADVPLEPTIREKLRPKLLSFHENRRPPYWGTWRKCSECIKPRRPFYQDKKHLDYEVDSDEEWEEEQEGESIDGSAAGSDDEQEGDEYEVDNEVFVPHGYLSDEEATIDEDDVFSLSPETQKARLKHLEDEFECELKKPTERLKPRMYGPLWETKEGEKPEKCVDSLWNYFQKLAMIMNDPIPFLQPSVEPEETEKKKSKKKKNIADAENSPSSSEKKKKTKEAKDSKKCKPETKKNVPEVKKNQPGINTFLTKLKSP